MEKITSKDNRLVKEYVRLSTSKAYRDETGLFVLEGWKLIQEAMESGVEIRRLFVAERCLEKWKETCVKRHYEPVYTLISNFLENKLSQQKAPQGIYAVAEKLDKTLSLARIGKSGCYVMLCDLQDAGNVGTILRTAEAMGIDGVIVTKSTCDLYSPKVLRGSMGTAFRIPVLIVEDAVEFLGVLGKSGVQTYASILDPSAYSLTETSFVFPAVLLIGNEGHGLSPDVAGACRHRLTIPMKGRTESLNAAMAACILLWEMSNQTGGGTRDNGR